MRRILFHENALYLTDVNDSRMRFRDKKYFIFPLQLTVSGTLGTLKHKQRIGIKYFIGIEYRCRKISKQKQEGTCSRHLGS